MTPTYKIIIGIFVLSFLSCGEDSKTQSTEETPIRVKTQTVVANNSSSISFSGEVVASQASTLKTKLAGNIKKILVDVGDVVQNNQLLIQIDSDDLNAQRQQAQAGINQAQKNFEIAQKDLKRFERLKESNSISEKELEQIQLQFEAAQSGLESAKQQLNQVNAMMSYTQIRAPFSGVISNKMIQAGDMAMPGMPLLSISSAEKLEVKSNVSEAQITQLSKNQNIKIQVPSLEETFKGKISEISNSSLGNGSQYFVKTSFDALPENVLSGMYAQILVENTPNKDTSNIERLFIPKSALVEKNGLQGVYVVGRSDTAMLRWLKIGNESGESIEVLSGLKAGDKIITSTSGKIYNGKSIKE